MNPSSFSVEPGQIFPSMISYPLPQPQTPYDDQPEFDPYAQYAPPQSAPSVRSQDGRSHSRHSSQHAGSSVPMPQEVVPLPQSEQVTDPVGPAQYYGAPARTAPPLNPSQVPPDGGRQILDYGYQTQARVQPPPEARPRPQPMARSDTRLPPDNIPRPDIVLPPREAAPSIRSTSTAAQRPQPHYLPKRLVMPAPLQPQQAPDPSMNGASARPDYTRAQMSEDALTGKKVRFHRDAAGKMGRAEEIPISQGPNVLRKKSTNLASAYNAISFDTPAASASASAPALAPVPPSAPSSVRPPAASAPPMSRRSSMLVENIPANSGGAMYPARVDGMHRAATISSQRVPQAPQFDADMPIPRDMTKEREVERALTMAGVSIPLLNGKDKKGRKLSKRR